MNRRNFIALGSAIAAAELPASSVLLVQDAVVSDPSSKPQTVRQPVLVRSGLTRRADGREEPARSQQTVVRSVDSEGRLAAFVVPIGEHEPYAARPFTYTISRTNGCTFWQENLSPRSEASASA
jgi:hypothetical protein